MHVWSCARSQTPRSPLARASASLLLLVASLQGGCTPPCHTSEYCPTFDLRDWCATSGECTSSGGGPEQAGIAIHPTDVGDGTTPFVFEIRLAALREARPVLEVTTVGAGPTSDASLATEVDGVPAGCTQVQRRTYAGEAKWECPTPRTGHVLTLSAPPAYGLRDLQLRLRDRVCDHPRVCED